MGLRGTYNSGIIQLAVPIIIVGGLVMNSVDAVGQQLMSYRECLEMAEGKHSHIIKAETYREDAITRKNITVRDKRLPDFDTRITVARDMIDQEKYEERPFDQSWSVYTGVSLFDWSTAPKIKKATHEIGRTNYAIHSAKSDVAYWATAAYFSTLANQAHLKNAEEHLDSLVMNQEKYSNDTSLMEKTDAAIFETQLLISQYQNKVLRQRMQLQRVLYLDEIIPIPSDEMAAPQLLTTQETFFEMIFHDAASILAQYHRISIDNKRQDKKIASAPLFPKLDVGVQYGQDFMTGWKGFIGRADLVYKLWNWNITGLNKDLADNEIKRKVLDYNDAIRNLQFDLNLLALDYDNHTSAASQLLVDLKWKNYENAIISYESGEMSVDDFMSNMAQAFSARNSQISHSLAAWNILNSLCKKAENHERLEDMLVK